MKYIDDKHRKLDKNISDLSIKSDILRFIDPINKFDELEKFIDKDGLYKPVFLYNERHIQAIWDVLDYIKELYTKLGSYMDRYGDNLTKMMYEKVQELEHKFKLVMAYHHQDIDKIVYHNQILFGKFADHKSLKLDHKNLLSYSITNIWDFLSDKIIKSHEQSELIDKKDLKKIIEHSLGKVGIIDFKLKFQDLWRTNMQVSIWERPVIYINEKSDYDISSLIISVLHEIYGHLNRWAHASNTEFYILKWGTGYYLSTEEGIATFQWARYEWYKDTYDRLESSYQLWYELHNLNRSDGVELLRSTKYKKNENIFRSLLRWKRWLINVDNHCVFYKDKIYFDGFHDICNFIIKWWDLDKLFLWRIKIFDLQYMS